MAAQKVQFNCKRCGEPFERFASDAKRKNSQFCSKRCFGKQLALSTQGLSEARSAAGVAIRNLMDRRIGQTFGRLTVTRRVEGKHRRTVWLCKCECGKMIEVISSYLQSGDTRSCGCLPKGNIVRTVRTMHYPHLPIEDVEKYLVMKRATRKVEECLTQMR